MLMTVGPALSTQKNVLIRVSGARAKRVALGGASATNVS